MVVAPQRLCLMKDTMIVTTLTKWIVETDLNLGSPPHKGHQQPLHLQHQQVQQQQGQLLQLLPDHQQQHKDLLRFLEAESWCWGWCYLHKMFFKYET